MIFSAGKPTPIQHRHPSFTFAKLGTGRHREISPLIWVLSVLFLLRYVLPGFE